MAKKQKKNQNLIFVIISLLIILLVYFIIAIVRFFEKPVDTVLVKKGELINYEEVTGYIVRNEELIDNKEYTGTRKWEVDDGTRVSKGSSIATYVSKSEDEILEKISKLDEKIENAMESQQTIFTSDVKSIETEIENYIYLNIKNNTNLNSVKEYKKYLNSKIEKKAKIAGELSPAGSELKKLISERTEYEKILNNSEKSLNAPTAGLVSYRVDGLENVLTYDSISKLDEEELNKLKVTLDAIVPISKNKVKVIDNFSCYLVTIMDSDDAKNLNLNDTLYLRFQNTKDTLVQATVDYISNEDEKVLISFKINSNVEELTKYRRISFDVVWWREKGLKLTKDAISIDDSGIAKVKVKKAYYTVDAYVKILKETADYVIIDNYTDAELSELGIDESVIKERSTIKLYDEVLLN